MKAFATTMAGCLMLLLSGALAAQPASGDAPDREQAEAERERIRAQLEVAREQMREAAQRMAELSRELGEHSRESYVFEFMTDEDRGMIGVVLHSDDEDLKIASVTPGSPAEEAGIVAGDVIVAVNGTPVAPRNERGAGTPEGLRDMKVGDKVTLTLTGAKGTREVTVEAGRRHHMAWAPAMRELRRLRLHAPTPPGMPHLDEDIRHKVHRAMEMAHRGGHGWHRVELAALNPDLGRYFGASEGVLVVNAPEDNPLGLKGGDVILRIGERETTSPGHAFRIMRSYAVGETIEMEVMRDGRRMTLTHEVEEGDSTLGLMPAPPAPAVPAKPAVPAPAG